MIYRFSPVCPSLMTEEFAEEYSVSTHSGHYVADVALDWNLKTYYVTMTCWGGVPKALEGGFANLPSLEVALLRHVKHPERVNDEW